MPNNFTRHCLAVAITTAMLPSMAVATTTLDISGTTPRSLSEHYSGDLRLVGSVNATSEALVDLIGTVEGSLINDANMLVDINGPQPFGTNGTLSLERGSQVGGDVINNATLVTRNISDINVFIGGAYVQGSFINKGLIEQSDGRHPELSGVLVTYSTLEGGFSNEGTISGTGAQALGVELEHSRLGAFTNSGSIHGGGTSATGLLVRDDVHVRSGRIDNTGTISASGPGATAVRIESIAQLHNSGTISSEGVAVELQHNTLYFLRQTAGQIAGPVAIRGNDWQVVQLEGGEIRGELEQLYSIEVSGNSTLDSSRVDSRYLDIQSGRLTLTQSHSTLTGNLELGLGQLELLLSDKTLPSQPYLNVLGNAYIAPGGTVIVTPKPNDFSLQGPQRYQLIEASEWYQLQPGEWYDARAPLTEDDLNVVSTSGLLRINSFSLDGTILSAEVESLQGESAAEQIASAGASLNAQNAILAFSPQLGQLDSNDPVFQALANSDTLQTARIAEQLSPEANGAASLGALDGLRRFEASLLDRPDSSLVREGVQPWVQVIGSKLKSGTRQGVRGFDLDNRGIALGIDWGIGANGVAGLAYGHYRGDASSHNGNKLDSRGHLFGLFGNHHWGRFFVSGDLTLGWLENDHRRYIAGTRAKGEGDGREFGATLLAGYRFPMQDSMTLEPRVAARYSEVRLDSYSEKGSSAALRVNSTRYQSGELGAGLKLTGRYAAGPGTLLPEATLMGWYDNVGDRTSVTSTFLNGGTSFATRGVLPGRDSYEGTLGLRYQSGALTLGTGYSYTLRNDANARTAYASMSFSF